MSFDKDNKNKSEKKFDVLMHITKSDDFVEKRKAARLDIPLKVHYKITSRSNTKQDELSSIAKDVSYKGCLLAAKENIPINSTVEIQIMVKDEKNKNLVLKGTIMRSKKITEALYEYGINFENINKETINFLGEFFFRAMYQMIGLSNWPTDRQTNDNSFDDKK